MVSLQSEVEFKTKELERLLVRGKITVEQYLNVRAKMENKQFSAGEPVQSSWTQKSLGDIASTSILAVFLAIFILSLAGV